MRKNESDIARKRRKICSPGYYDKRMKHFARLRRRYERRVASSFRCTDEALKDMLRYAKRVEHYRRRAAHGDVYVLELTEVRFRMLARDIRGLFGFEDAEQKRQSLVLTAQLLNKTFRVVVPDEWFHD